MTMTNCPLKPSLSYALTGVGWSRGSLTIGGASLNFEASYLSDAFGDLVGGVLALLDGAPSVRFSFEMEPGEYRWICRQTDNGGLAIQVLWFDERWTERPDAEGEVRFSAATQVVSFAQALKDCADELLVSHGLAGYLAQWVEAPFPAAEYRRLCKHLGAPPHPASKPKERKLEC